MRNYWFIGIVLALALLQAIPPICAKLKEWQEESARKEREYQLERTLEAAKESQNALMAMQRYRELRERERYVSLSWDERSELDRITDDLGYWFEKQGKKLTKRYGLVRFDKDEIDALVGFK